MKQFIPRKAAAWVLAKLWICAMIVALSVPCILKLIHFIQLRNLVATFATVAGVYAPHLGLILTYFFTGSGSKLSGPHKIDIAAFKIALLLSVFWNLLVVGLLVAVPSGALSINEAREFIVYLGGNLSWLVAPALSYLFMTGKALPSDEENGAVRASGVPSPTGK